VAVARAEPAPGPASPAPAAVSVPDDVRQAQELERANKPLEAAALYEKMAAEDATKRLVLAHRLVRIYVQARMEERALRWAKVVIEQHPDPQAYLAGVYGMLDKWAEAAAILEGELAKGGEPRRRLVLLWQLADLHEQSGAPDKAAAALTRAVETVRGTPDEAPAQRRLDQHREKHKPAEK
jgi:tetratricopeptide (TPR) repeat protein